MTRRVVISADRVSISRPGLDVMLVGRTPQNMVMDSNFPQPQRVLISGTYFATLADQPGILFPTQTKIPMVEVYTVSPPYRVFTSDFRFYESSGIRNWYNPYYVVSGLGSFAGQPQGPVDDYDDWVGTGYHWHYIVWKP